MKSQIALAALSAYMCTQSIYLVKDSKAKDTTPIESIEFIPGDLKSLYCDGLHVKTGTQHTIAGIGKNSLVHVIYSAFAVLRRISPVIGSNALFIFPKIASNAKNRKSQVIYKSSTWDHKESADVDHDGLVDILWVGMREADGHLEKVPVIRPSSRIERGMMWFSGPEEQFKGVDQIAIAALQQLYTLTNAVSSCGNYRKELERYLKGIGKL